MVKGFRPLTFLYQRFEWWEKCPMQLKEDLVGLYNRTCVLRDKLTVNLNPKSYRGMLLGLEGVEESVSRSLKRIFRQIFVKTEPIEETELDKIREHCDMRLEDRTIVDVGYKFCEAPMCHCVYESAAVFKLNGKFWLFSEDGLMFYDSCDALCEKLSSM